VIYAQVSSSDQKSGLRPASSTRTPVTENQYKIDKVVTELGSALNGRRPKFLMNLLTPRTTPPLNTKEAGRYGREQGERDQRSKESCEHEFKNGALRLVELSNRSLKQVVKGVRHLGGDVV
jgi:hypothetical protein